jgi:hypothetical protein
VKSQQCSQQAHAPGRVSKKCAYWSAALAATAFCGLALFAGAAWLAGIAVPGAWVIVLVWPPGYVFMYAAASIMIMQSEEHRATLGDGFATATRLFGQFMLLLLPAVMNVVAIGWLIGLLLGEPAWSGSP